MTRTLLSQFVNTFTLIFAYKTKKWPLEFRNCSLFAQRKKKNKKENKNQRDYSVNLIVGFVNNRPGFKNTHFTICATFVTAHKCSYIKRYVRYLSSPETCFACFHHIHLLFFAASFSSSRQIWNVCFLIEGNQFFFIAILSLRNVVCLLSKSKSSKIPAHTRTRTAVNYTHEHARQLKKKCDKNQTQ